MIIHTFIHSEFKHTHVHLYIYKRDLTFLKTIFLSRF